MNFEQIDIHILKSILSSRKNAIDFANDQGEKLLSPDLWRFAKLVVDFIKVYKECPTKRLLIEKAKSMKNDALVSYVSDILDKIEAAKYDDIEFRHDFEKLKSRYSEKLVSKLKESISDDHTNTKQNIDKIQKALNEIKTINQVKAYRQGSLKEYVDDFKNSYAAKLKDPNYGVGIKTGYSFLDYQLLGLRKEELFLIGGITNSGKSLFLMNLALNMWKGENSIEMTEHFKTGANVLLFSLEMSYNDYCDRMLAAVAGISQRKISQALLDDTEKAKAAQAFKFIKNYNHNFTIVDIPKKATSETILSMIEEYSDKNGFPPDVVVIDYMNLMSSSNSTDQDWLQQAYVSEEIHSLAREKKVVILSAIQLNPKTVEGKDGQQELGVKSPRRATQIIDNCDFFCVINTRKNERSYPDFPIELVKSRRSAQTSGRLHKNFECCAILDSKFNEQEQSGDISKLIPEK